METKNFPVVANGKTIDDFTFDKEGQWRGPFWFMQAADTQLGMIDSYMNQNKVNPSWDKEIELCKKLVHAANSANPKPRFVVVCGDLVDAYPLSLKSAQVKDFKSIFAQLDADIKPICVCGNHDVGNHPTPDDIEQYRRDFGDDYYSFWVGGVKFITFNSQYFIDDRRVKQMRREQDDWMDEELRSNPNRIWKYLIGFQHIPPFVKHPNEARVEVPGTDLSFNICDLDERRKFLAKLKKSGMCKLFCGHYHRNDGGWDENLEVIVTSAVGCQLGDDDHGFRVVKVLDDRVCHIYHSLNSTLTHIDLYQ